MDRDFVLQSAIKQNLDLILNSMISLKAMEDALKAKHPEIHKEYLTRRESLKSGEYGRKLGEFVNQLQHAFASIQNP
jgi:hypothetical protein